MVIPQVSQETSEAMLTRNVGEARMVVCEVLTHKKRKAQKKVKSSTKHITDYKLFYTFAALLTLKRCKYGKFTNFSIFERGFENRRKAHL